MSLGAGISVANLYYIQPLLATIASSFHTSAQAAGSIATVTQVGYALGLLLVVPLGDALEKRRLIQAHRGKVWVDSEIGRGSSFSFLLPIHVD